MIPYQHHAYLQSLIGRRIITSAVVVDTPDTADDIALSTAHHITPPSLSTPAASQE